MLFVTQFPFSTGTISIFTSLWLTVGVFWAEYDAHQSAHIFKLIVIYKAKSAWRQVCTQFHDSDYFWAYVFSVLFAHHQTFMMDLLHSFLNWDPEQ